MRVRPKPNSAPDDLAFGINAVAAALGRGLARSVSHLEDVTNPRVLALLESARTTGVPVASVNLQRLDDLTKGGVHQGIIARLKRLPETDLRGLKDGTGPALTVLLDGITDPQNLGSILRTAVALDVEAVVLPRRRGALLTPGVHRASAGLSFLAPVTAPQNLAAAVRRLREGGFWVVASDAAGEEDATQFDWPDRTALVLGSEGKGVSRLLRDEADFTVALPMGKEAESLNVGVAFGALGYLWRRRWPTGTVTRGASSATSRTAQSPPP